MKLSVQRGIVVIGSITGLVSLLVAAGNAAGPLPYGFAGPPGGSSPQFGYQQTTLRQNHHRFDQTEVWTHGTRFAPGFPLIDPTGLCLGNGATNLLPTVELNMLDILMREMPNTLPSRAGDPYNLHEKRGDPGEDAFGVIETPIDGTSPTTDLIRIFRKARHAAMSRQGVDTALIKVGVNILEGVDLLTGLSPSEVTRANAEIEFLDGTGSVTRRYQGFPLLHYRNGSDSKTKVLTRNAAGQWEVTVRQIWYDSHIESDTAFLDVSPALNEPWIINYVIYVLDDGEDDFSPFVMYFSRGTDAVEAAAPNNIPPETLAAAPRAPHVAMDATFYPMKPGNAYRFRILHAPGKYYNLTYHWGWRVHPPRVQALENAAKTWSGPRLVHNNSDEFEVDAKGNLVLDTKPLRQWELDVFGDPGQPDYDRKAVIEAMIGDLAPSKRMWKALLGSLDGDDNDDEEDDDDDEPRNRRDAEKVVRNLEKAEMALLDWRDRTKLPAEVQPDPDSNFTMIYLNNTLYGQWRDGRRLQRWMAYQTRAGNERKQTPDSLEVKQNSNIKITLLNGDRYVHGYLNVDFGGARGWENTFGPTIDVGGGGAWFSFGRVRWWINAGAGPQVDPNTGEQSLKSPIFVRPVRRNHHGREGKPGKHVITLHFNYDPARRLRMYQFDPLHHDVAIYSLH